MVGKIDDFVKLWTVTKKHAGEFLESAKSIIGDAQDDALRNIWKERGLHGAIGSIYKGEKGIKDAFSYAFTKKSATDATKRVLDYKTIAGSYIGVSAGMRFISGGGVYKDKDGNTNLIGVPFV